MKIKTRAILSVLIGGFPMITKQEEFYDWQKDYDELLMLLPVTSVKGTNGQTKYQANYTACKDRVLEMFPAFNTLGEFVTEHARRQVLSSKIVNEFGQYSQDYFNFCAYLIDLAEDKTGKKEHPVRPEFLSFSTIQNQ